MTLLMAAARRGKLALLSALLKNGANINSDDRNEKTVLMYAAEGGNKSVIDALLKNGLLLISMHRMCMDILH